MRTFKNTCAQGDIYIRRVEEIPAEAELVSPEQGRVVVTHSETGHDHVMESAAAEMFRIPGDVWKAYLKVYEKTPLRHLRTYDTHEPIMFEPGNYIVHRQREYTPEGLRQVQD